MPSDPVSFTVSDGDTLQSVSERLEEQGFVEDAGVFRWYTNHNGGLELTPGYFELRTSDHMGNLLAQLRTPPSETYTKVTFPEGFTVQQIAARLERDMATMTAADVMAATADPSLVLTLRPPGVTSLEGLLFPDTYQVSNGESPAHVLGRMVGAMERVGSQEDIVGKGQRLGRSPYEILIIASLIEREAKTEEDRPKIARVIYNRLARGMPLAIDASVLYGTRCRRRPGGDTVRAAAPDARPVEHVPQRRAAADADRQPGAGVDPGRPQPGANPSVGDPLCDGLPEGTPCEYLFYVLADEEGNHAFAVTLEQHEANVQAAAAAGVLD